MIEFNKSNLFDRERAKYQKFLNTKLFTPEEYASRIETSDQTMNNISIVDTESFLGGSPIDLLGDGQTDMWNMGFDDESSDSRRRHVDMSNERSHETGVWWKDILYAPFFLIVYVGKSMVYDFPNKKEWVSIFKAIQKVSIVTFVISLILLVLGFKFIFNLPFQTVAALLMFGLSTSMEKWLGGKNGEENDGEDASLDMFGGGADDGIGGMGSIDFSGLNMNDDALDMDGNNLSMPTGGGGIDFSALFSTPNADNIVESVDTGKYKILKASPIIIDSTEEFERTLMQVFMDNEKYRGVEIPDRKDLIESLHGYIVTNDKAFGSWGVATAHSTEFKNVAYALFKGLGQIMNSFLNDEEVMIVRSIKSNPLLYKIEVELPNYFKSSQIQSKIKEIEDALRNGESDNDVQVFVAYYQGIFVFKFLRLDNPKLISLGDILRFYDEDKGETALEAYANPKMGLPILIGLKNNEYPYVVDLEANTSGVIIGGSGSGKSWFTFLMLFNFVLTNDYNNVNFVVFDKKNAAFWNQFAKFPHVLGYHTEKERFLECMRELYAEVGRRKDLLVQLNEENIKGYRERLRSDKKYDKLKEVPNLIIIVDEITSTMQDLETMYTDSDEIQYYKEYRAILAMISQEGRSLGVRLLCIGQRSIDTSVPKNVIANSSFKFAMKMDAESDFGIMLGKEADSAPKPQGMGLGLVKTMSEGGLHPIKTLTVGGANEYQILRLIRVLALEWVRRADGIDNILDMPEALNLPKCYNRSKFVQNSLQELEDWRILSPSEVTPYKQGSSSGGGGSNPFEQMDTMDFTQEKQQTELPTFELPTMDSLGSIDLSVFNESEDGWQKDLQELPALDDLPDMSVLDVAQDYQPKTVENPFEQSMPNVGHPYVEPTMVHEDRDDDVLNDKPFNEDAPLSIEQYLAAQHAKQQAPPTFDTPIQQAPPTVDTPIQQAPPTFDTPIQQAPPTFDTPIQQAPPTFDTPIQQAPPTFDTPIQQAPPTFDTPIQQAPPTVDTPIQQQSPPTRAGATLQDFERMHQETIPNKANLKISQLKIYGHILRYGEKVESTTNLVQARIHRDALLATFSNAEVLDAPNHTHIMLDGDYYHAWKSK